jgi:membrane protease YdiL (CAAX protease family)
MLQSPPNPELGISVQKPRNPWAIVDLVVFGCFSVLLAVLILSIRVEPIYAIPLQAVFDATLIGFIALWVRVVRRTSFIQYVHLFRGRIFSTAWLIRLGAVLALSVSIVSLFLPPAAPTPLEKLLSSATAVVLFAIFGIAAAPLTEEIIFRGFLFHVLSEIGGSKIAVAGSAVLFAGLHLMQVGQNWGAAVLIFIVGFILSFIRYRSNSVISSFIVHTSYNASLIVVSPLIGLIQKLLIK